MVAEEFKKVIEKFGFEKGQCKKGLIEKRKKNHLAAYDFSFSDFLNYSTDQPIAIEYQTTYLDEEGNEKIDLIVYLAQPNFARIGEILNKSCCVAYKDELYIKPNYCEKCKLKK